jgi:thiol-disulfide isomerase/thioredoxin
MKTSSLWQISAAATFTALAGLAGLTLSAAAQTTPATTTPAEPETKILTAGDPAPELKVATWVKGAPIEKLEKGRVYVIEFWATWCGPCRTSMPHLSDLARKYKDDVTVIAVSIWEDTKDRAGNPHDPTPEVREFVEKMGDKMDFHVAYGGPEGPMEASWMRAANRNGIPSSFIVDREGRIAWIGHPMKLDETLEQVVKGKFDPRAEADRAAKQADFERKGREMAARFRAARQGGRAKEMLDIAREMMATDSRAFQTMAGNAFIAAIVNMKQTDLAYEFAREMFAGPIKDNPLDLNAIAWTILDDAGVANRDIDLAMAMAKRAVEITESKDGAILDTYARAYWEKNDKPRAVELQQQAYDLVKNDTNAPAELVRQLKDTLDKYKRDSK